MDEKLTLDELCERAKERREEKRPINTYQNDITEYLKSKLEGYNVPLCTVMEIAQYCVTQTIIVSNDELRRAYKYWEREVRKGMSRNLCRQSDPKEDNNG